MKVSEAIRELEYIKESHGDIDVQIQTDPKDTGGEIIIYESVHILPEEYENEGWFCNIRSWPY